MSCARSLSGVVRYTLLFGVFAVCPIAHAERLVVTQSSYNLFKYADAGQNVALFGMIQHDRVTVLRRYDVVVVVVGPRESTSVRGINGGSPNRWINFVNAPRYYAVLSNRPLDSICPDALLRQLQLGQKYLQLETGQDNLPSTDVAELRERFIQNKVELGTYREAGYTVSFLTPDGFRADAPFPANSPAGAYQVSYFLFADGQVLARSEAAFELSHVGLAAFFHPLAVEYPWLFGLGMVALVLGLLFGGVKLVTGDGLTLFRWKK